MAVEDIFALVATKLATITGPGIILPYKPIAEDPKSIVQVFGGGQSVKSWAISFYGEHGGHAATAEKQETNREVLRVHTLTLGLYLSVNDVSVTEPIALALSEAAMATFRPVIRTGSPENIWHSLPMQRPTPRHIMLGGTLLTHLWEHTLEIWERTRNVGL